MSRRIVGTVISGSVSDGLIVRLDKGYSLGDVKTGKFVSVFGKKHVFFSLITDLSLHFSITDLDFSHSYGEKRFFSNSVLATTTFVDLKVKPMIMIEVGTGKREPVKTIPEHCSVVYESSCRYLKNATNLASCPGEETGFLPGTAPAGADLRPSRFRDLKRYSHPGIEAV
jgi:hypothetical protein